VAAVPWTVAARLKVVAVPVSGNVLGETEKFTPPAERVSKDTRTM
jgi:hypothetical protein